MLEPDPPIAHCSLIVLCALTVFATTSSALADETGRWENTSNSVAVGTSPLRNRLSFTGRYRFVAPNREVELAAPELARNTAAPTSQTVTGATRAIQVEPAVAVIGEPPAAPGATRAVIIDPPMTAPARSTEPTAETASRKPFETGKSASLTADPTPEASSPQLRDGIVEPARSMSPFETSSRQSDEATDTRTPAAKLNAPNAARPGDEKAHTVSATTSDTSSLATNQPTSVRLKSSEKSSRNRSSERTNSERAARKRSDKARGLPVLRSRTAQKNRRGANARTPSTRRPEQGADAKALVGPRWARSALFAE